MKAPDFFKLIIAVIVSELAGFCGAFFTTPAITSGWYASLSKPPLNPPSWVFAPVWSTLFLLMGISAFLVWEKGWYRADVKTALALFLTQLFLNLLWSIIFFGLHNPGGALIDIILLWLAIAILMKAFSSISKPAMWLLLPYLLWVSFATYLNLGIWLLN